MCIRDRCQSLRVSACLCLSLCMSVSLSECLPVSACLSVCLSVSQRVCLSLSVCLYVCQSLRVSACLCLSLCMSVRLSACLPVSVSLYVCPSLSVSACLCLSVCLSVSQRVCLSLSVSLYVCQSLSVSAGPLFRVDRLCGLLLACVAIICNIMRSQSVLTARGEIIAFLSRALCCSTSCHVNRDASDCRDEGDVGCLSFLGASFSPHPSSLRSLCVCCLLYTSPSPRDHPSSRMPSSA